jgi:hypothetical protein
MGSGKLYQRLRIAIERAEHLNSHVNLWDYEVPAVVAGRAAPVMIYNSTEGVRVVVKCEGCCPGRCHYRMATPKTLSQAGALICRLCMVGGGKPERDGVCKPCATEQDFIVVVWELDLDQQFMHQVVPPYWHQSSDFYNYVFGYYVQVDGCVHWRGMYRYTSTEVLQADFGQALSALEQGATLVRIHATDLQSQDLVAATLTAGQGFVGIVLSPAYACQQVCYQSQSLPYIQALVGVNTNLLLSWGPAGSILISKK